MKNFKMNNIEGVTFTTGSCGFKKGKKDIIIIQLADSSNTSAVFTSSKTISEPVRWSKNNIKNNIKAIVVNSGNANAMTGKEGFNSIKKYISPIAKKINCSNKNILVASTGVIGEQLDYKKVNSITSKLIDKSKKKCCSWNSFCESIMTTDTVQKFASRKIKLGKESVSISGVAKGSGMIYPKMGTMLAFIFTDASIPKNLMNKILLNGVKDSFNSITVDGDTSTSDSVFFTSTSKRKKTKIDSISSNFGKKFIKEFNELLLDLAKQIIKDGEGAKKFIKIVVKNSKNYLTSKKIAFSIANSILVKTLLSSNEVNFGRVFMAIGKSNEIIDQKKISFSLNNNLLAKNGQLTKISEKKIKKVMNKKELSLEINLNNGKSSATVYTCDLTNEYIKINTNYLT
ncbi:MAG: bifunctional ornithine acetyltransferase/N-acetylglutamate synthase [Pelagibacteraceae bacterium]|nr:bifunctional ornithine acetyltransferase/N-acetylglutamate synthase [Pelagibacteraceae bacterium]PPR32842.1 MAG: Arginine biosynthesis bifunctional protein ArgJ [Alphaproteobacteria bacterium MarineAlpha6_Bin5]